MNRDFFVKLTLGTYRVTDLLSSQGHEKEEIRQQFGHILEAFEDGVPPHGGIGLGFDRFVALMCGTNDIREVIAFPKNKNAECPMDGSPSHIAEKQLKELGIKVEKK